MTFEELAKTVSIDAETGRKTVKFNPKKFSFVMVSYIRAKFFEERHLEKLKRHFSKEFMNRTVGYYCNAKHYGFEKEFLKYRKLYNKNWLKYFFTSGFCFNEYLMHLCFRLHIPYGEKIYKKLKEIAVYVGLATEEDSEDIASKKFILKIKMIGVVKMNNSYFIEENCTMSI